MRRKIQFLLFLFLCLVSIPLTAQNIEVKGIVTEATTNDPLPGVTVKVKDCHNDTGMKVDGEDLTVAKAKGNSGNPFSNSEGAAQTYPTAGDALYSLMKEGEISFTQYGGYVSEISDTDGNKLSGYSSEDYTEYYGWYYCVIDGEGSKANIVEGSDIVSASVLPVDDNDTVVWAFGTEDEANNYFDEVLSAK